MEPPAISSLARPRFTDLGGRLCKTHIVALLRRLGLPMIGRRRGGGFWLAYTKDDLSYLLHDAREVYKRRIRLVAPRKATDCGKKAMALNSLWTEIERRFNLHLNPESVTQQFSRMIERQGGYVSNNRALAKQRPMASGGTVYARICRLPSCGKPFTTAIRKKMFCCRRHSKRSADIAWNQAYRNSRPTYSKICKLKKCSRQFMTHSKIKVVYCPKHAKGIRKPFAPSGI